MIQKGMEGGELHLFDTWKGVLKKHEEMGYEEFAYMSELKMAKKNLPKAIYHIGDIVETKKEVENVKFAFVHFDLDIGIPLEM